MTSRLPLIAALALAASACASPGPCPQCVAHEEREAVLRGIIEAQGDIISTLTVPPHEPGDIVVVPPEPQDNTEDV